MRVALVCAALMLLAGCSQVPASQPGAAPLTAITPARASDSTPSISATARSEAAPGPGAPMPEAIRWVEAARPVDGAEFGVALRDATTTPLGDDVAFTTPSGTSCMTDKKHGSPTLACLVDLADPPPQPPEVYGAWKGGWVDFDGADVQIGSAHGDPGRFGAGRGSPLPQDRSLSFGDFRCRTDATTLVCVNYARQSAVRYSDDGIDTYGCTRESSPPVGVGILYNC